jgi:hypothetical protein
MKITALYNNQGVILAAVVAVEEGYNETFVVPEASEGSEVGTFEVPESLSKLRLDEVCTRLRVDAGSKRLVDAERSAD